MHTDKSRTACAYLERSSCCHDFHNFLGNEELKLINKQTSRPSVDFDIIFTLMHSTEPNVEKASQKHGWIKMKFNTSSSQTFVRLLSPLSPH